MFIFAFFKLHTQWRNAQCVRVPATTILLRTKGISTAWTTSVTWYTYRKIANAIKILQSPWFTQVFIIEKYWFSRHNLFSLNWFRFYVNHSLVMFLNVEKWIWIPRIFYYLLFPFTIQTLFSASFFFFLSLSLWWFSFRSHYDIKKKKKKKKDKKKKWKRKEIREPRKARK